MITYDELTDIIINEAVKHGVEKGEVKIAFEIGHDKTDYHVAFSCKNPFYYDYMMFFIRKEDGDVDMVDIELLGDWAEKKYKKMVVCEEAEEALYKKLKEMKKLKWLEK